MALLFVATILLIIPTITAPVVNGLSLLRVDLAAPSQPFSGVEGDPDTDRADGGGYTAITYGTFGYCLLGGVNGDRCSDRHIGYKPADVATSVEGVSLDSSATNVANGLTGAMVLHPVACGITFLAFLVSLGAGVIGSLAGFAIAAIAWVLTLVVMAIDFTLFAVRLHPLSQSRGVVPSSEMR